MLMSSLEPSVHMASLSMTSGSQAPSSHKLRHCRLRDPTITAHARAWAFRNSAASFWMTLRCTNMIVELETGPSCVVDVFSHHHRLIPPHRKTGCLVHPLGKISCVQPGKIMLCERLESRNMVDQVTLVVWNRDVWILSFADHIARPAHE